MKKKFLFGILIAFCMLNACSTEVQENVNEVINNDVSEPAPENPSEPVEMPETKPVKEKPYHAPYPALEPIKLHLNPSEPVADTGFRDIVIHFDNPDYKISKTQSASAQVSIGDIQNAAAKVSLYGNSTIECAKRPIKIKFQERQMLGDGGKKYHLISNIYDKSFIHNYVVFELAEYMDGGFHVPYHEFVNVYVTYDGLEEHGFQGVYLMAEKISQSDFAPNDLKYVFEEDYRVYYDDPENGVEGLDWFWMGEDYIQCFEVKEDTSEEICADIKARLENIWDIILEKDWEKIQQNVDIENITKAFLLDELIKDPDVGQTSVYWGFRPDGRLCIASIWDNDLTFGSGEVGQADEGLFCKNNAIFGRLLNVPEFKEYYRQYFLDHYAEWQNYINKTIDSVTATYYADFENEYLVWESKYNWCNEEMKELDYQGQIAYMKSWLDERIQFLKNEL